METWLEELKKEFGTINPPIPNKTKCKFNGSLLSLLLITLLSCACVYYYKSLQNSYIKLSKQVNCEIKVLPKNYDNKINELEERIDLLSDRTWLLSLVLNNNTQKAKYNVGEWIYIENNWKIKYPENLQLNDKEKELLKPYIK